MKTDKKRKNHGIFFGMIFIICHTIFDFFASGSLYKIFTSFKKAEANFDNSATVRLFKFLKLKLRPITEAIQTFISKQFENSLMLKAISSVFSKLFGISGKALGAFSMTWSTYVIIIAFIKRYSLLTADNVSNDVILGIIVILMSIPLMFSDKPLCELCFESPVVFSVLTKIFGIPPEVVKKRRESGVSRSVAVIFGIVFGLLTYVIPASHMLIGLFLVLGLALVLTYPESGVVMSISVAPLLGLSRAPSRVLAAIVLLTAFAYTIKVIRGKRVLNIGLTDLAFTGILLAVFLAGFAPGESNTLEHALLCCSLMLIFPLTVNLMKYRRWLKACAFAFVFPAVIVAFIGIAQYSLGFAPSGWIDESLFSGITSRAVSLFNNPNILGLYLTMLFPFVLTLTLSYNEPKMRILGCILASFVAVCTVFTFSRSAWLALVLGGVLFAIMLSPKGMICILPASAAFFGASLLFPDSIGVRLKNFGSLADSANNYRMAVWNSSWDLLTDVFAGGIGLGEEAFKTAYIGYAAAGTQYAMHSHSLYMQIVIQIGLVGLLLFGIFVFNSARQCCSSLAIKQSDEFLSGTIKAAIAGAFSMLVVGMFDYTWYNYRVFFIFWALIGFACAAANLNNRKLNEIYLGADEENSSSVVVPITKNAQKADLTEIKKEFLNNDGREED